MKVELIDKILFKFNNIDKVKLVIKICEKLSDEEANKLFKVLDDNKCTFKLLEEEEIINKCSSKKLIEIIHILKDNEYNEKVLSILIEEAKNKISNRNFVDKNVKEIINLYKNHSYNQQLYELITILKGRMYSEILDFVSFFYKENIQLNQISADILKNDNLSSNYKFKFLCILRDNNYDSKVKDFLLETINRKTCEKIYEHINLLVESNFDVNIKHILFSKIYNYKDSKQIEKLVKFIVTCPKDLKEMYDFLISQERILSKGEFDKIVIDVKQYYEEVPRKYFDNIINILGDYIVNSQRSYEEIKVLINYYKESNYSDKVYNLILSKDMLKNRAFQEQILLIELFAEYKKETLYNVIIFKNYLIYDFSSQKAILKALIKTNFNIEVANILCNKKVIYNKSFEEIIYLINILKDNSYEKGLIEIISNDNLNKIRSFDQIKELIDIYIKSKYDNKVLNVILDEQLLLSLFDNQKNKIINIIDKKEPFSKVLNEIKTLEEMKKYVGNLKNEGFLDIYEDTPVPVLTYKK